MGLNPERFGYFLCILMLEALTCVCLGLAVSALAPNAEVAQNLGPLPLIVSLIFGGFFINLGSLPAAAEWLPYISFLKWVFESLVINEFTGVTFTCELADPTACAATGEEVLKRLTFTNTLGESVAGLFALMCAFMLLAFTILHYNYTTFIPMGFKGRRYDAQLPAKQFLPSV